DEVDANASSVGLLTGLPVLGSISGAAWRLSSVINHEFVDDQFIANSPDRLDLRRAPGELIAQPGDVDVDRSALARVIVAPNEIEELVASEDDSRVTREGNQEVELLW